MTTTVVNPPVVIQWRDGVSLRSRTTDLNEIRVKFMPYDPAPSYGTTWLAKTKAGDVLLGTDGRVYLPVQDLPGACRESWVRAKDNEPSHKAWIEVIERLESGESVESILESW